MIVSHMVMHLAQIRQPKKIIIVGLKYLLHLSNHPY